MLRKIHGTNFFHIKFFVALTSNVKMDQYCPQLRFFIEMIRFNNIMKAYLHRWSPFYQSLNSYLSLITFNYHPFNLPTNPQWARVARQLSLCVIHKEGLCPSSGDINRLMMMEFN
jgi:hypothetical protein